MTRSSMTLCPRVIEKKNKNKQIGPNKTLNILHSKGSHKKGEKAMLKMRENNRK